MVYILHLPAFSHHLQNVKKYYFFSWKQYKWKTLFKDLQFIPGYRPVNWINLQSLAKILFKITMIIFWFEKKMVDKIHWLPKPVCWMPSGSQASEHESLESDKQLGNHIRFSTCVELCSFVFQFLSLKHYASPKSLSSGWSCWSLVWHPDLNPLCFSPHFLFVPTVWNKSQV